ncbi:hypothetical protein [Algivirga pacifica]|uniref:Uncharacterized protein n=1 Tax=Algivirga pacifica TaxID=1162670 RepID=A0ABP9DA50_9BACT
MEDFIIEKVGWLTTIPGNESIENKIRATFRSLVLFLQKENLTTRKILDENEFVDDNKEFKKSDLTNEGFILLSNCLSKWRKKIDKGGDYNDLTILEKELKRIRIQNN